MPSERTINRALQTVRVITPPEQIDTLQRANRALDNKGRVIDHPRRFVRLLDENGDVWRVKISSAGTISGVKET